MNYDAAIGSSAELFEHLWKLYAHMETARTLAVVDRTQCDPLSVSILARGKFPGVICLYSSHLQSVVIAVIDSINRYRTTVSGTGQHRQTIGMTGGAAQTTAIHKCARTLEYIAVAW